MKKMYVCSINFWCCFAFSAQMEITFEGANAMANYMAPILMREKILSQVEIEKIEKIGFYLEEGQEEDCWSKHIFSKDLQQILEKMLCQKNKIVDLFKKEVTQCEDYFYDETVRELFRKWAEEDARRKAEWKEDRKKTIEGLKNCGFSDETIEIITKGLPKI